MKNISAILLSLYATISMVGSNYNIIPYPQNLSPKNGFFELTAKTKIVARQFSKDEVCRAIMPFTKQLNVVAGYHIDCVASETSSNLSTIILKKNTSIVGNESYILNVSPTKIEIEASSEKGCFYALQTIRQLLPKEFESKSNQSNGQWKIPCCEIADFPQFRYRGMHLDVSRHFATVDEVKRIIDQIAFLKLNTFHWHLTDDQGWRIEVKKYPRLTEIGGFRDQTLIGHSNDIPHRYDQTKSGGFYTQEQIKEVVKYASDHFVEVIPEIEMPGHSMAALSAYPQYSCTGGPFDVPGKWGIFNDIYCTKEATFQFLQDILSEVVPLFPSKYIHIGGDEAPKIRWKNCVNCQNRIKNLGLKNEQELQSYFIHRIENFLNQKGKQIIGWDEILEGGLAPNATVMSWRGEQGGITAARQGHDVIMTPSSNLYLDYYQSQLLSEPLAIGGYLPIEKVYSYNPISDSLNADQTTHILGLQANVWTEYMATATQREYMIFPRIAAVAEVGWSNSKTRSFDAFANRLPTLLEKYDVLGLNYSKAFYDINGNTLTNGESLSLELESRDNPQIRYTTDGAIPTLESRLYQTPIPLGKELIVKSLAYVYGKPRGGMYEQKFSANLFAGAKVLLSKNPSPKYSGKGGLTLVDCITGRYPILGSQWLGYEASDVDIEVALNAPIGVSKITLSTTEKQSQWIYCPANVEFLVSEDGITYRSIGSVDYKTIIANNGKATLQIPKTDGRKIKAIVKNYGIIPAGLQGGGHGAWLFIDEFSAE